MHGWILLDKPQGLTSTHAVTKIRRLFGQKKAGHAGTLDPLATGVLGIALGEATKTIPYLVDAVKEYTFTVRWGEATDTADSEGNITATSAHIPNPQQIQAVLVEFEGAIRQQPPAFSAVHINGQRAYTLARQGVAVDMPWRTVEIHKLDYVSSTKFGKESQFHVECGKGTYIRSLAQDIALRLGTVGHIVQLRRTRVGNIRIQDCTALDQLAGDSSLGLLPFLHPVARGLDDIPAFAVHDAEAARLLRGQSITLDLAPQGTAWAHCNGIPVAIGQVDAAVFRPVRVFNLSSKE